MESPIPGVNVDRVIARLEELDIRIPANSVVEAWIVLRTRRATERPKATTMARSRSLIAETLAPTQGPAATLAVDYSWPKDIDEALVLAVQLRCALEAQDGVPELVQGAVAFVAAELAHRFIPTTRVGMFLTSDGRPAAYLEATTEGEESWLAATRSELARTAGLLPSDLRILAVFECNGPTTQTR